MTPTTLPTCSTGSIERLRSAPSIEAGDSGYPAFRRPVERSDLTAFLAGFFPSIGRSISFWPAEAFRGFLPVGAAASLARLFLRASMRSTTLPPLGLGL